MDDKPFVPAEAFPPGEYIKDELEERGWTQADLAEVLGTSAKLVSDIVAGKSSITPETAHGLGQAFTTSPQVWMNLDTAYRLWRVKPQPAVARRARVYSKGPIKEMLRRQWIQPADSVDALERNVMNFYGISSIDDQPTFQYAAKKATRYGATTPAQLAWLIRAKALARAVDVSRPFSDAALDDALTQLRPLMQSVEDVRHVARILAQAGIRLVILEPLKATKIDAATFWLDDRSPVIVVSLRYGRLDWFWFALLHELDHVRHRDGFIEIQLVGQDATRSDQKPAEEQRADKFAAEFEIPAAAMASFIARVKPLYSKVRIIGLAARLNVHPAIVVGQLQYRNEISYAHSRDLLPDVRAVVTDSALTDGWGNTPQTPL